MEDELDQQILKSVLERRFKILQQDREYPNQKQEQRYLGYKYNEKEIQSLIQICTSRLEQNPYHKKALFIRASSYMKINQFQNVITDCDCLLQLDTTNVGAFYLRGCAFDRLNKTEQAIQDFTQVLNLDQNHINAAYARGACYNRQGNYQLAIDDYHMALEKDSEERHKVNTQLSPKMFSLKINEISKKICIAESKLEEPIISPSKSDDFLSVNEKLQSQLSESNQITKSNLVLSPKMKDKINGMRSNKTQHQPVQKFNRLKQSSSQKVLFQSHKNIQNENGLKYVQVDLQKQAQQDSKIQGQLSPLYPLSPQNARKAENYGAAVQIYSEALKIQPNHFKCLFNRGFAYDKLEEFDKAIEDYTKAIELEPKNAFCYYNRGISQDKKGNNLEAIQDFTAAIRLDSTNSDFYHNRGFTFRKTQNYEKAIEDYSKAILMNKKHFKAYYNRVTKGRVGLFPSSKAKLEQCYHIKQLRQLKKQNGQEILTLSFIKFYRVKILYSAIQIEPKYAESYNARGLLLEKMEKLQEAIQDFSKAIEADSKNANFWLNRGCCLRNMKRKLEEYEKAISDYTLEIKNSKHFNLKARNNRAFCLAKLGNFKNAIQDYTDVLNLQRTNMNSLHNRGICYQKIGLLQNAINDFTQIIQLDGDNANAFFNRGCCFDSLGQMDHAIADYSTALELEMNVGRIKLLR